MANLKEQVRQILEEFPETRNSDAHLLVKFYEKYDIILRVDSSLKKWEEIFAYHSPDDIIRWRRQFNNPKYDPNYPEGRYLATNPEVLEGRKKRVKEMQEELGYGGEGVQQAAITNNQLNKGFQKTII